MSNKKWTRYRWHQPGDDYRPITFPPPGPWWCSGMGDGYSILVAFLPEGVTPSDPGLWPEAEEVEACSDHDAPEFSERFPQPKWWTR